MEAQASEEDTASGWAAARIKSKVNRAATGVQGGVNWAVTRQIPGYGTLQGQDPVPQKHAWFQRGSVWGLLVFIASEYTGYIILSWHMCLAPFFGQMDIDRHFSCKVGEHYIKSYTGSVACEYLKSYVWIFPQLIGTTMLLLVGRELVQKRFYYYLLYHGGVLSYMAPPPLRDIIMVGNLFVFSQFWLFVLLVSVILYTHGVDPAIAAERAARAGAAAAANPSVPSYRTWSEYADTSDKENLAVLIHLLVFLGIPGIFVITKLWGAYDIERTMVPLSEYIRDCSAVSSSQNPFALPLEAPDYKDDDADEKTTKNIALNLTDLSALVSLKDHHLKEFLSDTKLDELVTKNSTRGERYDDIVADYPRYVLEHIKEEPPRLQLCDSLWPAPFLMAKPFNHMPWRFDKLWFLCRVVTSILSSAVCICLVFAGIHDGMRGFADHHQAFFRLPGIMLSLYLESLILRAFLNARAFVKHTPLPEFMEGSPFVQSSIRSISSLD
mmetsp:Transcript_47120/g.74435  ORF Transcript_47120/g.74435 Transcript_47120/m.74435 type:complete len:496 (+) Transcript_47120:51-1538(+)